MGSEINITQSVRGSNNSEFLTADRSLLEWQRESGGTRDNRPPAGMKGKRKEGGTLHTMGSIQRPPQEVRAVHSYSIVSSFPERGPRQLPLFSSLKKRSLVSSTIEKFDVCDEQRWRIPANMRAWEVRRREIRREREGRIHARERVCVLSSFLLVWLSTCYIRSFVLRPLG